MKKARLLILFLSILLIFNILPKQSISQDWERFDIDFSGCTALFPYQPEWEFNYSTDSSYIWTGETYQDGIYFGAICVEFAEPFDVDYAEEDLISVAEEYLDYLRQEFKIVEHSGYETGYWLESDAESTGIADSWTDETGDPWIVKAWIDPYNMAVMYMYSGPENNLEQYKNYFLDSFRFPE
jgi:hypothetical protein